MMELAVNQPGESTKAAYKFVPGCAFAELFVTDFQTFASITWTSLCSWPNLKLLVPALKYAKIVFNTVLASGVVGSVCLISWTAY